MSRYGSANSQFLMAALAGIAGFLVSASPPACAADPPSLAGWPVAGYAAWASGPEIRAILGVPGAAVFSDPLPLPASVRRIHLPSGQAYAVLERIDDDPAILPLNGAATTGEIVPLSGALRTPDLVAFSPSGRSAVFFSETIGRLQVIVGLPLSPVVARVMDATRLPDRPETLAISDDGRLVLVSSSTAVYSVSPDASAQIVATLTQPASLMFLPADSRAVFGDKTTGTIYVVEDGAARVTATGLAGLAAISPSVTAGLIYVTNPGAKRISSVEISTGLVVSYSLPVHPRQLRRLGAMDAYLISSGPGEPAWIFFRQGEAAKTVFVPAVEDPSQRPAKRPER